VTISLDFEDPVDITSASNFSWGHFITTAVTHKLYFYNSLGQFAYSVSLAGFNNWVETSGSIPPALSVPSSASYTPDDVLSSVKKITFIIRYVNDSDSAEATLDLKLDNLRLTP